MNGDNPNGAAMALWQKFSDLQAQAEVHRGDRLTTEAQSERLLSEIAQLKLEQQEDEKKARLLEERAEEFQMILEPGEDQGYDPLLFDQRGTSGMSIHEKLELADKDYQVQTDRLNAAEQSWEQWNQWKQEQMISAAERSRKWRSEMERLQVDAISVGLPYAYLNAARYSSDPNDPNFAATGGDVRVDKMLDDGNENDPLSWTVAEDDLLLHQAVETYKKHHENYLAESSTTNALEENIREQQVKCEKKKRRASSLREQINKINNDRADLKAKLQKVSGNNTTAQQAVGIGANPYHHARMQGPEVVHTHPRSLSQAQGSQQMLSRNPYASCNSGAHQLHAHNPYARGAAGQTSEITQDSPSVHQQGTQHHYGRIAPPARTVDRVEPPLGSRVEVNPRRAELADICVGRRRLVGRDRQFGCTVGLGTQHAVPSPQDDVSDDDEEEEAILSGTMGLSKKHKAT